MDADVKEVSINGVVYVQKNNQVATQLDGMPYVIARTFSAGLADKWNSP